MQTNGVTESDVKEVIKKQLENAPKRKGGGKTQMIQLIGLIQPLLIKIWNCIVGIIFYCLILGHSKLMNSIRLKHLNIKVLAFEVILFIFPT